MFYKQYSNILLGYLKAFFNERKHISKCSYLHYNYLKGRMITRERYKYTVQTTTFIFLSFEIFSHNIACDNR